MMMTEERRSQDAGQLPRRADNRAFNLRFGSTVTYSTVSTDVRYSVHTYGMYMRTPRFIARQELSNSSDLSATRRLPEALTYIRGHRLRVARPAVRGTLLYLIKVRGWLGSCSRYSTLGAWVPQATVGSLTVPEARGSPVQATLAGADADSAGDIPREPMSSARWKGEGEQRLGAEFSLGCAWHVNR